MKQIKMKSILLVLGLTLCLPSLTKAQNSIAKVEIDQLIDEHPKKDEYFEKLDELENEYDQDLKDMTDELSKTFKKYDTEADSQSAETNAARLQEEERVNDVKDGFGF